MNVCDNINPKRKGMTTNPVQFGRNLVGQKKNRIKSNYLRNNETVLKTSQTKSSTLTKDSHVIIALTEGRGQAKATVGMAVIDVNQPKLILCQLNDSYNYVKTLTKINIFKPNEILIPATFADPPNNHLFLIVKQYFPEITINAVPRREFVSSMGSQYISQLCAPVFNSVVFLIKQKFYATSACCALLRYIEHTWNIIYSKESIKVEYLGNEMATLIDIDTTVRLCLVKNINQPEKTLFSILDYCCTTVGKRLLRINLLQPFLNPNDIETRLDCVEELVEKSNLHKKLREILTKLSNVDRILSFATISTQSTGQIASCRQMNYVLQLKAIVSSVEPLCEELSYMSHSFFTNIVDDLKKIPVDEIMKLISTTIQEEASPAQGQAGNMQRCFAVKTGCSDMLDVARKIYTDIINSMRNYVENLGSTYNLCVKLVYNLKKGYHLKIVESKNSNVGVERMPKEFIKVDRAGSITATTMELLLYNSRLKYILHDINQQSNK